MTWLTFYLASSLLTAAASFVAAGQLRDTNVPVPDSPHITALIAGILWPIIAFGAIQLVFVMAVQKLVRVAGR